VNARPRCALLRLDIQSPCTRERVRSARGFPQPDHLGTTLWRVHAAPLIDSWAPTSGERERTVLQPVPCLRFSTSDFVPKYGHAFGKEAVSRGAGRSLGPRLRPLGEGLAQRLNVALGLVELASLLHQCVSPSLRAPLFGGASADAPA